MPEKNKKKQLTEAQIKQKRAKAKAKRQRRAARKRGGPTAKAPALKKHMEAMHNAPGRTRTALGNALSDYIACPGEYPVMKFPDRSCVAAVPIKTRALDNLECAPIALPDVPLWDWLGDYSASYDAKHILMFGQLARAYMHGPYQTTVNGANASDVYKFSFPSNVTTSTAASPTVVVATKGAITSTTTGTFTTTIDVDLSLTPVRVYNTYTRPYLGVAERPIGIYRDKSWIWLNYKEAVFVAPNWLGGGQMALQMTVHFINPNTPGDVAVLDQAITTYDTTGVSKLHYYAPQFGWYNFTVNKLDYQAVDSAVYVDTSLSIEIRSAYYSNTSATTQTFIVETPAAEITASYVGEDARRTACGLLVSCMASNYTANGTVTFGRTSLATKDAFLMSTMIKATGAGRHHILKGLYSYMAYDEHSEDFAPAVTSAGGLTYPLLFDGFVHHIVLDPGRMTTTPGLDYVVPFSTTLDMAWEFRTSSQLYKPVVSKLEMQLMYDARSVLNQAELFFFENPLHMKDITNLIRRSWNGLRGNARNIATAAKIVAPGAFGPLITALGDLLQR